MSSSFIYFCYFILTLFDSVYPLIDPAVHWKSKTFKDKVVLVTGASRGIGLTTAIFYARAGARLALVSRKLQTLEESKAAVLKEQPDAQVLLVPADVVDPNGAVSAIHKTVEAYGRLDILIANAGSTTTVDKCKILVGFLDKIIKQLN
jgi:NAD(P)-dependent dehydrogenase (short-subunit alcohol dehydrogenase family)